MMRVLYVGATCQSLSPAGLVTDLTLSLKRKDLLEKVELDTCHIKDFPSLNEFKAKVLGVDVLLSEPDIFKFAASTLFSPDLSLKFVQLNFAGCDKYMEAVTKNNMVPPKYPVARLAGIFGSPMAEYVVGQIISFERRFPDMLQSQKSRDSWSKIFQYRLLCDLTIGILGLGDIGHEIAKQCKSFGMTVYGLTRTPVPVEKRVSYVDQYRLMDQLEELLATSDYVCNLLPSTPQTVGLLDRSGFKSCAQKKSIFINIGRGDIVKESTIIEAIKEKRLGGAILDVFINEPLPPTNELWELENVIITPHVSGLTMSDKFADLVADQIERYINGKPLLYLFDCEKGY